MTIPNRIARWGFAVYALALFVGTHWPQLKIHGPLPRTDILLHMIAFGGWTTAITLAGFFGPRWSGQNLHRSLLASLAYAGLDELSQGAMTFIHRTCAWDDFGANAAGVLAAGVVLWILSRSVGGSA